MQCGVRPKPQEAGQGLCTPPGHRQGWLLEANLVGQGLGAWPVQTGVSNPELGTQQNTWPPTNLGTNPLLPHPAPPPSL